MGKLLRYELRKNRTLLLVILGVIAALEGYFLIGVMTRDETRLSIGMVLLIIGAFATAIAIFIMGVSGYSRELNQKSSYLIFMTPRSPLSIIGSKLIFTLVTGVIAAALLVFLAYIDVPLLWKALDAQWRGYYNLLDMFMEQAELSLTSLLLTIAFYAVYFFVDIMSIVSVAYFAITLSATFMRGKKGHGVVSVVLFLVINYAINILTNLFIVQGIYSMKSFTDLISFTWPLALISLGICVICLFVNAWMLDKKVDL